MTIENLKKIMTAEQLKAAEALKDQSVDTKFWEGFIFGIEFVQAAIFLDAKPND